MEIGNVKKYGLFDSRKNFSGEKKSPVRLVQSFEFDYILSCDKTAVSNIGGKSAKLRPNMLIVRKPNQTSNSILHFKCYCLHLSLPRESSLYQDLMTVPEYFTLINADTYQPIFEAIFGHLLRYPQAQEDYFLSAKILELVYHLKKDESKNRKINTLALQKENDCIQKAVAYMKQNADENIDLERLGDVTGYSPNHFQRVFCEIMGVSPQKFLEKIRVERAELLLVERDKSISEIAYECGFSSQSYFSKIFKKYTQLTPLEYQKKSVFKHSDFS